MIPNKYDFGMVVTQTILDQKKRHDMAVSAAQQIATTSSPPCPISVEPACRQTEQDPLEKKYDIAPGCGYYRRRYDNFKQRNPTMTPPSYYLEYGEKYCNRFTRETYNKLSPEGKKWFDEVKCDLQAGIENILQDPKMRYLEYLDSDFSDAAFKMHAPVYLENGLADIPFLWDQWNIGLTPIEEFLPGKGNNVGATWGQVWEVFPDVFKGWFN